MRIAPFFLCILLLGATGCTSAGAGERNGGGGVENSIKQAIQRDYGDFAKAVNARDFATAMKYIPECKIAKQGREVMVKGMQMASDQFPIEMSNPKLTDIVLHHGKSNEYAELKVRVELSVALPENATSSDWEQCKATANQMFDAKNMSVHNATHTIDIIDSSPYYAVLESGTWRFIRKEDLTKGDCVYKAIGMQDGK